MDVRGKVALVTGSAVGVGRATVLELAKRGAAVVVNYSKSEDEAQQTLADVTALGAKALLVRADVSSDDQVRSMVDRAVAELGGLNILVNNAAMTHFVPFEDLEAMTEEKWDRILAVNLKGSFFCARAAAAAMRQGEGGAIVNVASIAGIRSVGSSIAYAASKAGVINMTIGLARVLGPKVRVNCVAPGFIDSRWLRGGLGDRLFEIAKERTGEQNPLGRVSTPEDVAQVIVGVIEDWDFVTGQTLVIDGGNSVRF